MATVSNVFSAWDYYSYGEGILTYEGIIFYAGLKDRYLNSLENSYVGVIKITVPSFIGVSEYLEFNILGTVSHMKTTTLEPFDRLQLRYALCTSDENHKNYTALDVEDENQIFASFEIFDTPGGKADITIRIQTADLIPNTDYFLILYPYLTDDQKHVTGSTTVHVGFLTGAKCSVVFGYSGNAVYIDNGTELVAYRPYIDNGNGWEEVIPYIDNGERWISCGE